MKIIKIDLPKELNQIEIIPMADLHLGDLHCEYKKIMETIAYTLAAENRFVILNGDLMNCATKGSVSDVYSEAVSPMDQLKQAVKIFGELAENGRILACLSGNHEQRIWKESGIDITSLMCDQLGIADRYADPTSLIFIRFGNGRKGANGRGRIDKLCYTIYASHGHGGGKREGGKVNTLADLASIVDADCYVMSHTHLPVIFKNSYYRVSAANSSVQLVDKLFVNTNSYLGSGGYGERFGFKPPSNDQPIIYLDGTKKRMKAEL